MNYKSTEIIQPGNNRAKNQTQEVMNQHSTIKASLFYCQSQVTEGQNSCTQIILLQGIFPTQGSNHCLLHWLVDSLLLSHQGSPDK